MVEIDGTRQAAISRCGRVLAGLLAVGLLSMLVAAGCVKPDPRRLGTHQRFGLPPCTVRVILGIRCPSCGMTTSWAHLVRGQPIQALKANTGGALLALLAVVAVPWLAISAMGGRWFRWTPGVNTVAWVASTLVVITIADWVFRLVAG